MIKIKKQKIIIVIPAGHFPDLTTLCNHLEHEKDHFDEVHIWANTYNLKKIKKIKNLAKKHNFTVVPINPEWRNEENCKSQEDINNAVIKNIGNFMSLCTTNDYYIRLDTDICFIEKGAIKKIIECRLKQENKDYFLVYGNIVNNPFTYFQYQQKKILKNHPVYVNDYNNHGRNDLSSMLKIHEHFKKSIIEKNLKKYYFQDYAFESKDLRIPINVISWHGKKLKDANLNFDFNEEDVITNHNSQNLVCGNALFVHFSYASQRKHWNDQEIKKYKNYYLELTLKKYL